MPLMRNERQRKLGAQKLTEPKRMPYRQALGCLSIVLDKQKTIFSPKNPNQSKSSFDWKRGRTKWPRCSLSVSMVKAKNKKQKTKKVIRQTLGITGIQTFKEQGSCHKHAYNFKKISAFTKWPMIAIRGYTLSTKSIPMRYGLLTFSFSFRFVPSFSCVLFLMSGVFSYMLSLVSFRRQPLFSPSPFH